jgi:hypothetical protein
MYVHRRRQIQDRRQKAGNSKQQGQEAKTTNQNRKLYAYAFCVAVFNSMALGLIWIY